MFMTITMMIFMCRWSVGHLGSARDHRD